MSWKALSSPLSKQQSKAWCRFTIFKGVLYGSHLGEGFGTRDLIFALVLLELMHRFPHHAAVQRGVDFILYPGDKPRLFKSAFLPPPDARRPVNRPRDAIPFALSFARRDDALDVAVPDSSFFGWPEMRVHPHWMLAAAELAATPWLEKRNHMHWRGGLERAGGMRQAVALCAKHSPWRGAQGHTWLDVRNSKKDDWESPLEQARYKLALFMQGEGYTSSKQRDLASGSCPVFVEQSADDTFYGRFLKEGKHFVRVPVDPGPNQTMVSESIFSWVVGDATDHPPN